jgi:hypothetical protein
MRQPSLTYLQSTCMHVHYRTQHRLHLSLSYYRTQHRLTFCCRSSHASPHTQPLPALDPNALSPFQKVILVKVCAARAFETEKLFSFLELRVQRILRHAQLNCAFRFKLFFTALIPFVTISHRLFGPTVRCMPFVPLSPPPWAPNSGGNCFLHLFLFFSLYGMIGTLFALRLLGVYMHFHNHTASFMIICNIFTQHAAPL